MKRTNLLLITILLTINCSFFPKKSQAQSTPNYFDSYDPDNQLRPRINKSDFFQKNDFELGWLLLEPISIAESREQEPELAARLSPGQKALYFWWYLDGQVTNGGFIQFYFNGYGIYIPPIVKGLEQIGDEEMVKLVKEAHRYYVSKKKLIDKQRKKGDWGDLYDRLEAFSDFDDEYYDLNKKTIRLIEKYARQHPGEFCVDEDGNVFDANFSGKLVSKYANGKPKEEFELLNGALHGEYKSYFEDGKIQFLNTYINGEQLGEQSEWYEKGTPKSKIIIDPETKGRTKEFYHDNGLISKYFQTNSEDEKIGEYKEWFPNGQLKEQATYVNNYTRTGPFLQFWEDGSKKLEAEFKDGEFLISNFWNEEGVHLLVDGTGLYINEYVMFGDELHRNEQEFVNFKRHGRQWSYTDGVLGLYQEMENGEEHGFTRTYYDNGKVKKEIVYERGVRKSGKEFPLFDNPIVVSELVINLEDSQKESFDLNKGDKYPNALNAEELTKNLKIKTSLFDGYSQEMVIFYKYLVIVDENGKVSEIEFLVADNTRIIKKVEATIKKLIFSPAIKNNQPVKSEVIVRHRFKLAEKNH